MRGDIQMIWKRSLTKHQAIPPHQENIMTSKRWCTPKPFLEKDIRI